MLSEGEIQQLFQTALLAAQLAGKFIKDNQTKIESVQHKSRSNLVTEIDIQAERMIIDVIKSRFPQHYFLSEEINPETKIKNFTWIIDPIDGTNNYVHGFRFYCVSIAMMYEDEVLLGIINEPVTDEIFSAIQGRGAYLNKTRLQVSSTDSLKDSLLATGFPYVNNESMRRNMQIFAHIYPQTHGIRRAGSAALDLCYVAAGRFDGFWEFDLNPWDVAAGSLIVREAGGLVTKFDGSRFSLGDKQILASNPLIHQKLIDNILPYL